ncbi:hypothetical protein QUA70_09730 [Microcoleus sp. LAD1_D5]|uniref:hypothetical protein n=1 Tax=unclassified Microcoleus TaxID=2642155 RepID=UPI002FD653A0
MSQSLRREQAIIIKYGDSEFTILSLWAIAPVLKTIVEKRSPLILTSSLTCCGSMVAALWLYLRSTWGLDVPQNIQSP